MRDVTTAVADALQLSDADRSRMLPSGRGTTIRNRVGWAKTYLHKAGLVELPKRGFVRITDAGLAELEETAGAIDYAANIDNKIVLIDGETLGRLMIDHGLGVSTVDRYEIKRLDSDYFESD